MIDPTIETRLVAPSSSYRHRSRTVEQLARCMYEAHLDVLLSYLKARPERWALADLVTRKPFYEMAERALAERRVELSEVP